MSLTTEERLARLEALVDFTTSPPTIARTAIPVATAQETADLKESLGIATTGQEVITLPAQVPELLPTDITKGFTLPANTKKQHTLTLAKGVTYLVKATLKAGTGGNCYLILVRPSNGSGAASKKLLAGENTLEYTPSQEETLLFSVEANNTDTTITATSCAKK